MAQNWAKFPHAGSAYLYEGTALKKHWDRLHRSDCEPLPKDAAAQDAWRAFHAGEFQRAVEVGFEAGGAGVNAAIKAQSIYANYIDKAEKSRLALFEEAAGWADERRNVAPSDANAHYLYAYALGRYSQGIFGGQSARAGLRRQDQGCADQGVETRARARGCARRVRRVSGRGHRQGRRPGRRDDLRSEKGLRVGTLPAGAEAQSRLGDQPHRICKRPDLALRQGAAG